MNAIHVYESMYRLAQAQEAVRRSRYNDAAEKCLTLLKIFQDQRVSLVHTEQSEAHHQQLGEFTYMLAIKLYQMCNSIMARQLLRLLGCTYTLVPAVFQKQPLDVNKAHSNASGNAGMTCETFSDVLPGILFKALTATLEPQAAFWHDHNYFDAATPFFSYLHELGDSPHGAVEAAIQQLHAVLKTTQPAVMEQVTSAEWWAHCREVEEPHQLHFDMKEAALRKGVQHYQLKHPVISSVLYLTEHGGPTAVLGQTPQGPLAQRGWLVQPCPNQLVAFPGNLLHGVLPGLDTSAANSPSIGRRITLIVAWWDSDMRAEPGSPGQGPCRKGPHTGAQPYCTPRALSQLNTESTADAQQQTAKQLHASPASSQAEAESVADAAQHVVITAPSASSQPEAESVADAAQPVVITAPSAPTQPEAVSVADAAHQVVITARAASSQAEAESVADAAQQVVITAPSASSQPDAELNADAAQHAIVLPLSASAASKPDHSGSPHNKAAAQINADPEQHTAKRPQTASVSIGGSNSPDIRCNSAVMIKPVWQCIDESCPGCAYHDEEVRQPAAKRQRLDAPYVEELGSVQIDYDWPQQVSSLPVPPLRFFLQSADEISRIYLPPCDS